MSYYCYVGGFCGYCGNELGLIEQSGGRNRQYCNDACKQSAHRKRKETDKRNTVLLRNTILQEYWTDNGIEGDLLVRLQDILVNHGKEAARAATDAALIAIRDTRQKYSQIEIRF
jgi:hypothetical protein